MIYSIEFNIINLNIISPQSLKLVKVVFQINNTTKMSLERYINIVVS
jgi:hypothetical protein